MLLNSNISTPDTGWNRFASTKRSDHERDGKAKSIHFEHHLLHFISRLDRTFNYIR